MGPNRAQLHAERRPWNVTHRVDCVSVFLVTLVALEISSSRLKLSSRIFELEAWNGPLWGVVCIGGTAVITGSLALVSTRGFFVRRDGFPLTVGVNAAIWASNPTSFDLLYAILLIN
ncbi:hypothetical protein HGRIS_001210 [Hohenbuehelia grisea]|uniref:Uncharacterized protein n=1 Tax=Hohenbuehelia grisea TaxID=104357 RepID=A0ABR3JNL9_9AGAR